MPPCPQCEKDVSGKVVKKCPMHTSEDSDLEETATQVDEKEKLDRLHMLKREYSIATPGQSPAQEPPTAKARNEDPLPVVPPFPKPAPAPGSPLTMTGPSNADIMQKLNMMMGSMALKTDIARMATKDDLATLQTNLQKQTKGLIADAVGPLKSDITELRQRMDIQENRHVEVPSSLSSTSLSKDQFQMMSKLDPSNRRIAFLGFPDISTAEQRYNWMKDHVMTKIPNCRYVGIDHFFKGPRNAKVLSKASFVEFCTEEAARAALQTIGGKNTKFTYSDNVSPIVVKPAISEINMKRNWSLKKATELITTKCGKGVDVKANFGNERNIIVRGEVAFEQHSTDLAGQFKGDFIGLSLS